MDCATDDVIIQNNGNIDIAGVIIRPFVGTDASVVRGPGKVHLQMPYPVTLARRHKVEAIAKLEDLVTQILPA